MSVSLKFTFDNIDEAQAFLAGKIQSNSVPAESQGQATRPVAIPAAAPVVEGSVSTGADKAPEPAAGGKGRKAAAKNATPPAPETPAAGSPPPAGIPPAPALTELEVRNALLKVSDKFGAEGFSKVAEVLAPFGIQKVKDIKPEQYAEVILAAEKLAA